MKKFILAAFVMLSVGTLLADKPVKAASGSVTLSTYVFTYDNSGGNIRKECNGCSAIPDANVSLQDTGTSGWTFNGTTDAGGFVRVVVPSGVHEVYMTVTASGFAEYDLQFYVPTHNSDLQVPLVAQ